jgi:TM2 domain-containing membrane protein YozV
MANLRHSYTTRQLLAGYCGIIFGGLGLHKFVLGYSTEGFIMLTISVIGGSLSYGIIFFVVQFIGLIEGMIYLNKSHEEFVTTYFVKRQGWF